MHVSHRPLPRLKLLTFSFLAWTSIHTAYASNVLERDIAIIGGGASGVYAALRLREMNHSFAIVEERDHFGGHVSTYTVPGTETHIDYGAQGFGGDEDSIRRFFGYYDIPLVRVKLAEVGFGKTRYVDFKTSTELPDFRPDQNISVLAREVYKYPELSLNTALPSPLPEDLALTFRDFVTKYGIESSVFSIYFQTEGLGDLLSKPTLYVFKYLNPAYLDGQLPTSPGFFVTERAFNQEVYLRAQADFGASALVSSRVVAAQRNDSRVVLVVKTPTRTQTIVARKLLVTMPPTLANMRPLDLDAREHGLFSRFEAQGWYVGLVNATGFVAGHEFINAAAAHSQFHLPQLPALYQISPTRVEGIHLVRYGSPSYMTESDVRADIVRTVDRVRRAVVPNAASLPSVELLAFSSHWPFSLRVSASDMAGGFYTRLDALQGHRSTWYTGATFSSTTASHVWNFTERLLPRVFE
ncbi:FAD dependent oxidoreductase family protein [Chaetomium strumarium]|uniref:FAD dependent oxidoreductase family protein n=1 Tax=Chaetomium strumarium TaxID=1170767 RepID=A0AAJ0GQ60_9PEZI|nr:FAD dependent oxidoreductase family protein [Chaetomium strumarium]